MTVHISRDYTQTTTGINVQAATTPIWPCTAYQLAIYLYRILGYTIVGHTAFDLDTTFRTLNVATMGTGIPFAVTTSVPHGLTIGSTHPVQIANSSGNVGNGAWTASVTSTTGFSFRGYQGSAYSSSATFTTGSLYASGLVTDGYGAGINFGVGNIFEVSIPVSVRTVVVGDVGKMLVLKSTKFPTKNSGIFKISGINAGSNRYIIDYRATENPPVEATNSMDWWLYEAENAMCNRFFLDSFWNATSQNISAATNTSPIVITGQNGNGNHNLYTGQTVNISGALGNTAANGNWTVTVLTATTFSLDGSSGNGTYTSGGQFIKAGYPGNNLSSNPRIILQSPHSTAWQVRICLEPTNGNLPPISITTGFNGNSVGDFPINAPQTHIPQYLDVNPLRNTLYNGTVPGQGDSNIGQRVSFYGESTGQYVFITTRPNTGSRLYGITMFGIPDNEPFPLPTTNERVFVYSPAMGPSLASQEPGGTFLRIGTNQANVGVTVKNGYPKFMALTGWANLDGATTATPMLSSNAGDSPFTGTTEVLPIEIWGGTYADVGLTTGAIPPFTVDQYYMGLTPGLRIGRANFSATPTLSTEEVTNRTVTAATNTSPIQITTSASNSLVTGQTVTISGVAGNTAANGTWVITRIDGTNFTLNGSTGNGTYTSGGNVNGCASWIHLTNGLYMMWNGPSGITA